jgi:hypothetical protein
LQLNGWLLLNSQRIAEAEIAFREVLGFNWVTVTCSSDIRNNFRQSYIAAGMGIIKCRKNSRASLDELFFFPATHEELLPILNAAKAEAPP